MGRTIAGQNRKKIFLNASEDNFCNSQNLSGYNPERKVHEVEPKHSTCKYALWVIC